MYNCLLQEFGLNMLRFQQAGLCYSRLSWENWVWKDETSEGKPLDFESTITMLFAWGLCFFISILVFILEKLFPRRRMEVDHRKLLVFIVGGFMGTIVGMIVYGVFYV